MGVSSNGKTAGLHPADEGSIPSTVHLVVTPWWRKGHHGSVRRSRSRFDPWPGCWFRAGVGLMASRLPWEQDTTGFDSPVPDWFVGKTSSECAGPHGDLAKVADQVRFLAGILPCVMVGMV